MKNKRDSAFFAWCAGLLGLALALTACGEKKDGPKFENPEVVARVNGEQLEKKVLVKEFERNRKKYRVEDEQPLSKEKLVWLRMDALNQMIQERILLQEVKRQGIELEPDTLEIEYHNIRQGYEKGAFKKILDFQENTEEEWKDKLKRRLLIKKLIQESVNSRVSVKEEELQKYFDEHQGEFQKGEQLRALHIMVENEDSARDILKLLRKGKKFEDLAREHSLGLESESGGDMGYFEAGQMPEEFDEVFELKVNKVSDIIRTPYGYHVFKVVDKKPERKMSFEESRDAIHKKLLREAQEKAFQTWLLKLKNHAKIEINYDALENIH
ncbi:putative Foldase protein prsA [Nitrospina gracilis 3/211]|uniref:Putative Foldase protein prsA n=1 Tax=Nitrospina gracilis (strain 3/211) TaxID=1266370 RepID=M1YLV0_NITG3|nr:MULTISPECIES: peptidyl-prolyl cis-trans isomerase [Nitrospina]MCF8724309.1 parvulin-like peptidyl-prolyl isomerase [Nitrospina sp. Nb-3]CCQ91459.1 putative Foldase protein prsA [Nitrospina gracilis 3/211]